MSDFFLWLHGWQSANFAGIGGVHFLLARSLPAGVSNTTNPAIRVLGILLVVALSSAGTGIRL